MHFCRLHEGEGRIIAAMATEKCSYWFVLGVSVTTVAYYACYGVNAVIWKYLLLMDSI